ncbi:unnamed protein product, partial [marine sediment metagenome]
AERAKIPPLSQNELAYPEVTAPLDWGKGHLVECMSLN